MTSAQQWIKPRTFAQLKPGCAIRSAKFPHLTGIYKFEGHGLAVIRMDCMGRDGLCKLKEIEMRVEGEQ